VLAAVKTRARYIGVLGSRRKTVLIEKMLREEGVDASRIRAIHAPVGLDLGGRTPAEIALSVLAEITAQRYQATGQSLRLRGRVGPVPE
jgi:xanthine dehydrogenase accessory factor